MENFRGKKITIMGLGLHGGSEGLIKYLVDKGANVFVTDLKTEEELSPTIKRLKGLPLKYHLGGHSWEDFKKADLIFINPAVPKKSLWYQKIKKSKIPTNTETNLFFSLCPAPIIGITGTNGKSTVATLIWDIFKEGMKDKRIFFGGNIGGSLLTEIKKITPQDLVILELSSFQLQDLARLKKSPHIAIVLNITPDHLDYHQDFEEYVEAKKNIVKFQQEGDFAILNYDDKITKNFANFTKAHILFFSLKKSLESGAFLYEDSLVCKFRGITQKIISKKRIKLPGEHNVSNLLAAIATATIYKIGPEKIHQAIKKFKGLEHRIEFVKEINGIRFYNDSKATTPESTIAALDSFSPGVILIAGGSDKNANFDKLAAKIREKVSILLLIGETALKIKNAVLKNKGQRVPKIIMAENLEKAVKLSKKEAQNNEIVLLSPACASFDQFKNFEERGEKFKKYVTEELED